MIYINVIVRSYLITTIESIHWFPPRKMNHKMTFNAEGWIFLFDSLYFVSELREILTLVLSFGKWITTKH